MKTMYRVTLIITGTTSNTLSVEDEDTNERATTAIAKAANALGLALHDLDYTVEVVPDEDEDDEGKLPEASILFADSNRGQYIPQYFAEAIKREGVSGVSAEEFDILTAGPDHPDYWETWDRVLNNARVSDAIRSYELHQDGDLWLVPVPSPVDAEAGEALKTSLMEEGWEPGPDGVLRKPANDGDK